jgi:hypothetical protein
VAWWQASLATATTWNVTQYGASPNGSTDDTAAINAVIAEAQSGDTVYFPAGVYDITNSINAKAGVALLGAGAGSTSIKSLDPGGSGYSNVMLNLGSQSNVQVSNLTLNGNNDSNVGYGISGNGASGENIHNIGVANCPGSAISVWSMTGATIANNQISNGGGIGLIGCTGCLTASNVVTLTTGGVSDSGGSNEDILNNTIGIINQPNLYGGICSMYIRGSNMLVQGNVMNHWMSCDTYMTNSAIRNNVVTATDGSQSYAGIEAVGVESNNVISGNVIIGGQGNGLTETNNGLRQYLYFANNTVRGLVGGMASGWGSTTGENQQIYLYANTFSGNAGTAFGFGGNCQNFVFDSNVFSGNGNMAVDYGGGTSPSLDKFQFVNNTFTNNAGGAMYSMPLTNQYFDSSNVVAGNGPNGSLPTTSGTFYNNMPTVSIVGSSTVSVGSLVNFSSLFNDPGGYSAANYLWDLGGGLPVTTSTASFTYSQTGTYDIGLVVWDSLGRAAHEQLVLTVTAAGAGSQSVDGGELGTAADPASVPEPSTAILTVVAGLTAAVCVARRQVRLRDGFLNQNSRRARRCAPR